MRVYPLVYWQLHAIYKLCLDNATEELMNRLRPTNLLQEPFAEALVACVKGDFQWADEHLVSCSELDDESSYCYFGKGLIYALHKQPGIALRCFEQCLLKQPTEPEFYYLAGCFHIINGRPRNGRFYLEMAIRLKGGHRLAQTALKRLESYDQFSN